MRKVALMTKKILVTEDLVQEGIDSLTEHGYEVDMLIDPTAEELIGAIAPYDALIVHPNTVVDSSLLDAAENLKIIGRAGVTVDNIDIEAASERGVIVCNAPNSNVISAAEHTMALLLAAARHIPEASASMHEGQWRRADFMGSELFGKTLAIFGLGRVGGLVAERAAAFGMNLIGHDPYCSPERALHLGVTLYDDMAPVLAQADFITVHLPRTVSTLGMFGADEFAAMKDGVVLVNAAPWRHFQHGRPGRFRGRRQDRGRGCGLLRGRALHRLALARVRERHPDAASLSHDPRGPSGAPPPRSPSTWKRA